MGPIELLLLMALGLVALGGGWWVGNRPVAGLKADRDALDEKFRRAIVDLAAMSERAARSDDALRALDALRGDHAALGADHAALRAEIEAREAAYEARLADLRTAREELSHQFSDVGNRLLQQAQSAFLERADQRFKQAEELSGKKIEALLQPVSDRLQQYEQGVHQIEAERREAYGNLTGLIDAMRTGQEAVRAEAQKLVNSLRAAPKARGRWGEQQLRNVLERCGLSEFADFQTEVSVDHGDGRLRPDVIIRVPGGKSLVIDAKVSLNAYQDAFGAVDDRERTAALALHAQAMKAHVNQLGAKAYWTQFDDAPDYVIMFVPGEHFVSAALEHDPGLWDMAFDRRVLLATPTNLIAIARTVAAVWRQEALARDARQIADLGKELYDRLAKAAEHMKAVGKGLNGAVVKYNEFVSSFESRVLVTGRKFRDLNVESGDRDIDAVQPIESLPRYGQGGGAADQSGRPPSARGEAWMLDPDQGIVETAISGQGAISDDVPVTSPGVD